MKINQNVERISENTIVDSTKFTIQASAKAFSVLISSLYSDPIAAIVRELVINGIDSHVMAGKDPSTVKVHFPSVLEPYFSVQDQGVGLTKEELLTILTVLFKSTKNDNNDTVGGLGLGAKTPFAYTKEYTVSAIKNGVRSEMLAYMAADGTPCASVVSETITEEPNGVTFTVPVASQDIGRWTRAGDVLAALRYKVDVTGRRINYIDDSRTVLEPGVYRTHLVTGFKVRMGDVIYSIPLKHLGAYESMSRQFDGIIIDFDIGELEIQPSRETLSFDATTVEKLITKINAVVESQTKKFRDEYALIPKDDVMSRTKFLRTGLDSFSESFAIKEYQSLKLVFDPEKTQVTVVLPNSRKQKFTNQLFAGNAPRIFNDKSDVFVAKSNKFIGLAKVVEYANRTGAACIHVQNTGCDIVPSAEQMNTIGLRKFSCVSLLTDNSTRGNTPGFVTFKHGRQLAEFTVNPTDRTIWIPISGNHIAIPEFNQITINEMTEFITVLKNALGVTANGSRWTNRDDYVFYRKSVATKIPQFIDDGKGITLQTLLEQFSTEERAKLTKRYLINNTAGYTIEVVSEVVMERLKREIGEGHPVLSLFTTRVHRMLESNCKETSSLMRYFNKCDVSALSAMRDVVNRELKAISETYPMIGIASKMIYSKDIAVIAHYVKMCDFVNN